MVARLADTHGGRDCGRDCCSAPSNTDNSVPQPSTAEEPAESTPTNIDNSDAQPSTSEPERSFGDASLVVSKLIRLAQQKSNSRKLSPQSSLAIPPFTPRPVQPTTQRPIPPHRRMPSLLRRLGRGPKSWSRPTYLVLRFWVPGTCSDLQFSSGSIAAPNLFPMPWQHCFGRLSPPLPAEKSACA